ncbi:MAG: 4'-phosphopantetheinyl transferase family protein [Ginsengibacter sp.]
MPLFYQHNINDSTKLAVWKITESEDFFLEKTSVQKEIIHPHKRMQHLAGRYLLEILHPGFPFHLIEIAESKKPLLSNGKLHFSISHCKDFAAAIVSENKPVGIDVEIVSPKIELVKERFLRESELELSSTFNLQSSTLNIEPLTFNHQILTLFWSAKESIFKWYGKGQLSFKNNMSLNEVFLKNEEGYINANFIKEEKIDLKIDFRFFESLCLAWVSG